MANEVKEGQIGSGPCPMKGCAKRVRVTLTKKGLTMCTGPGCCQFFSRSIDSDELVRACIEAPAAEQIAEPIAAPMSESEPSKPDKPARRKAASKPAPVPEQKKSSGWTCF